MIECLVEEAFIYDFLLLVVLVELLIFNLEVLQGENTVLKVIVKREWVLWQPLDTKSNSYTSE